ncbi:MAG: ATP-binding protein [Pseudomonadota bacterium]
MNSNHDNGHQPPKFPADPPNAPAGDLAVLVSFATSLLQQESLDDMVWSLAERIGGLLNFEDCVIYLTDGDTLVQVAAYGVKNPRGREIFEPLRLPRDRGIVGRVASTAKPARIADVSTDPSYISDQLPGRSELSVPIVYEDRVIGVIDSESSEVDRFSAADETLLQWIATIAAPRLASAQIERERQAIHRELKESQGMLERHVRERTQALTDTVAALEQEVRERRRIARALNHEKTRAQATLLSIGEGVIATNENDCITMMNPAAQSLTGVEEQAAIGRPLPEVLATAALQSPELVLEEGQDGVPLRLRHADGSERLILQTSRIIKDKSGAAAGSVVVFRDITRQRELEEDVRRTRRLESLGMLAGGIAHDFNNLLTSIQGNLSLALSLGPETSEREDALRSAERACETASALPNQLLALSKGGAPVKQVGVELAALIQHAVDISMPGSAIRCEVDLPAQLPRVDVDPGQITQVLQNLIINARQATAPPGKVVVSATTARLEDVGADAWVEISVADQGPGIPAPDQQRIFDPYFTTKDAHPGLGLTTSYWIAKRHGGALSVDSAIGEGARFTLQLPASTLDSAPEPNVSSQAKADPAHILVMDDEPGIRSLLVNALVRHGHRVLAVANGELALEACARAFKENDAFDVALLDLTVPGGMGGEKALDRLREIDPEISAVVMSGYSSDPILAEFHRYGFDARLHKPFTLQDLNQAIDATLRTSDTQHTA